MPSPSTRTSSARGGLRFRWTRGTAVAGLVISLAIVLAIVLTRPATNVLADDGDHPNKLEAIAPITAEAPNIQRFTAHANGLTDVIVRFGTYGGVKRCAVRAQVFSGSTTLADRRIECAEMPDTARFLAATFPPQRDSNGREYELRVTAEPGSVDAVSLWGAAVKQGQPPATGTSNPDRLSVEILTRYSHDSTVAGNIGLALHRMAQFGPPWRTPIIVVGLIIAAIAVLFAIILMPQRAVLLIVVFAVLKGLVWSLVVPPLEGVDEVAHYAYAQFMAVDHHIPQRGIPRDHLQPEDYSNEVYVAIDAFHQDAGPPVDRPDYSHDALARAKQALAVASTHSGGVGAAAGYTPVFYFPASVLYAVSTGTIDSKVGYMRLWSVALGAITVVVAYLIGRELFPRSRAPVVLALAVALQPMLSQEQSIINNDALVVAAGAWCLLVALRLSSPADGRNRLLTLWAGVAVGIAALGKPFGVVYIPVLAYAWVVGLRRGAPAVRAVRYWLREAGLAAAGLAGTYGAWFAFATLFNYRFASITDLTPTNNPKTLHAFLSLLKADWFYAVRATWIDQFWGNFSWVDTPFPKRVQGALTVAVLLLLAGLFWWTAAALVAAVRRRRARRLGESEGNDEYVRIDVVTSVCALAVVSMVGTLYALAYSAFRQTGDNSLIQGRYALLILPAVLALPGLLTVRFRPRVDPVWIMSAIAVAMLALNVLGIGLLTRHFYV